MTFPPPKAQPKHTVQKSSEDSTINETLSGFSARKQMKQRFVCKLRRGAIFKPKFKTNLSTAKLVYMAYKLKNKTIAFFGDLYHTFESKCHKIFEVNLPPEEEYAYMSSPLYCKGLFVFPAVNHVLVCNPATKEVITLPRSSYHFRRSEMMESAGSNRRVGFGFLQSTHAYKVAQFFYRSYNLEEKRYSMGFEVFTIGVSTSWRVLAKDPPYPIRNSCSTFACKCVYFYIWYDIDPEAPNAFLCFNLKSEKFSLVHPPYSLEHIYIVYMRLANLHGRLCLSVLLTNSSKIGVFTSRHGTGHDWTPMFCFSLVLQSENVLVMPILEYEGKLLIHVAHMRKQSLKFYDPKNESIEEVDIDSVEEVKIKEEGFISFLQKPWAYVSFYEESLIKLQSECKI